MSEEAQQGHHGTTRITIDGRPFDIESGRHVTASDLLRLAGLDPNGYDLALVRGHGEIDTFQDSQLVDIKAHEKFVSIRQTAPVA